MILLLALACASEPVAVPPPEPPEAKQQEEVDTAEEARQRHEEVHRREESRPARAPDRPARADVADLNVEFSLDDGAVVRDAEVRWPSARLRARLQGDRVVIPEVPNAEDCELMTQGWPRAKFSPVRGGQDLLCEVRGDTLSCAPRPPVADGGELKVTLARDMGAVSALEVRCGAVVVRSEPTDLAATLRGLPPDTDCTLRLTGGDGGRVEDVRAGQDLVCGWTLGTLWCQERKLPPSKVRGDLHVTFDPPDNIDGADVRCPDENQLSGVSQGRAFFEDIPADQDCWLALLGRGPAKVGPVRGGQSVICSDREGPMTCVPAR